MNILISGNVASLTITLVRELVRQKHHLVVASDDADQLGIGSTNTVVHSINPAGNLFRDVISAYGFDIVVYISARGEQIY